MTRLSWLKKSAPVSISIIEDLYILPLTAEFQMKTLLFKIIT